MPFPALVRAPMKYPIHVSRPEGMSLEPYTDVRKLLVASTFEGPSLAVLPNDTVRCGVVLALEALQLSRQGADLTSAVKAGGGGLLLVHSHGQSFDSIEVHARMLEHLEAVHAPPMLREASLLLVNNNGGDVFRRRRKHRPADWLSLYTVPRRLRMLVVTSLNLGYFCGEFQALFSTHSPTSPTFTTIAFDLKRGSVLLLLRQAIFAASRIVDHFPWVLYSSGPDPGFTRWPGMAANPYPSSQRGRIQGAAAALDTQGSEPGRQQASGGPRPPRLGPAELPFAALCEP